MMSEPFPCIVTGFKYIQGAWYLVWDRGIYRISQTSDRAIMLLKLIPIALRDGRDSCVPDYRVNDVQMMTSPVYDLKIVISRYDQLFSERTDFVLDVTFQGDRKLYEVDADVLLLMIRKIVRDMEVDVLQLHLAAP